jgi:hypothetical protein
MFRKYVSLKLEYSFQLLLDLKLKQLILKYLDPISPANFQ